MICTPQTFSVIYELEKKRVKRRKNSSLLIRIDLAQLKNGTRSNKLLLFLSQSLRAGDLISILDQQIYILIYNISFKEVSVIFKRIIEQISTKNHRLNLILDWEMISAKDSCFRSKIKLKI